MRICLGGDSGIPFQGQRQRFCRLLPGLHVHGCQIPKTLLHLQCAMPASRSRAEGPDRRGGGGHGSTVSKFQRTVRTKAHNIVSATQHSNHGFSPSRQPFDTRFRTAASPNRSVPQVFGYPIRRRTRCTRPFPRPKASERAKRTSACAIDEAAPTRNGRIKNGRINSHGLNFRARNEYFSFSVRRGQNRISKSS